MLKYFHNTLRSLKRAPLKLISIDSLYFITPRPSSKYNANYVYLIGKQKTTYSL